MAGGRDQESNGTHAVVNLLASGELDAGQGRRALRLRGGLAVGAVVQLVELRCRRRLRRRPTRGTSGA